MNTTYPSSWTDANATLGTRSTRKLDNHTYLQRRSPDAIAVKLHDTDIVTYYADGTTVLDSGRWQTPTTKDRMNQAISPPLRIWQEQRTWYLGNAPDCWTDAGKRFVFADGLTIHPDGTVSNTGQAPDTKTLRQVRKYARDFASAFANGKIPAPNNGDCWFCLMRTADNKTLGEVTHHADHILSHIEEKYYVPSLLMRAFEQYQPCGLTRAYISAMWNPTPETAAIRDQGSWYRTIAKRDAATALRKYIFKELGFAA